MKNMEKKNFHRLWVRVDRSGDWKGVKGSQGSSSYAHSMLFQKATLSLLHRKQYINNNYEYCNFIFILIKLTHSEIAYYIIIVS